MTAARRVTAGRRVALAVGILAGAFATAGQPTTADETPALQLQAATAPVVAGTPRGALPQISITTRRRIRDEPKVAARVRLPGSYEGAAAIELRGQSSQSFAKKSYGMELRGRDGKDRRAGLLGMAPDGDWVLHGPWIDKTLMRNALAYDAARATGRWAPQTRLVELELNGRYEGVYLLAERPELSSSRLDVEGKGVTGKYLVEWTFPFQARRKGPSFTLPRSGRPIVYEDPSLADLSPAEGRYLRGYLRATERALYAGDGSWRRYLDEPSTIDYVLVQELFRNVDAFHASTFLVKASGEKLRFGPVWDFDLSTGNARQADSGRVAGWQTRSRPWAGRLWSDCTFRTRLGARWAELQGAGFGRDLLARLDGYRSTLAAGPAGRNFRRWPTLDQRLWQSPAARGSYTAEVTFLRSWLVRRMAWMDRIAPGPRCS